MKTITCFFFILILGFSFQPSAEAQNSDVTEKLKTYFNDVVQSVHKAESADRKREILDESFENMSNAYGQILNGRSLSEEDLAAVEDLRNDVVDKKNQLHGLEGYAGIEDEDLDDFSEYSQQAMEQALNSTLTISLGTALIIILLLILL